MYEHIFDRTNPGVVDHVLDTLLGDDPILKQVREVCRQEGLPEIEVSVQQGKMLTLLTKMANPYRAIEIGTLGGYSTICIARGLGPDGVVDTVEYERKHWEVACGNFRRSGLQDRIRAYHSDAMEWLHDLRGLRPDFMFIDADKERNLDYLQWGIDHCDIGATIIVDNVIREGRVLDAARPEKLTFIKAVARLQNQGRLEASVVQTVGSKTWDGFVLARKT